MSSSNQKLTTEQLLDWMEGRLSAQEANQIEAQIADAPDALLAEVNWLRAFIKLRSEIVLDEPPTELRATLRHQFAVHHQNRFQKSDAGGRGLGFIERLIASLTFDSGLQPGFAGARKAGKDAQRMLILSTDIVEVVLNIQTNQSDFGDDVGTTTISGQLLPTDGQLPTPTEILLLGPTEEIRQSLSVDELGEFAFAPDIVSRCKLQVLIGEVEVYVELPHLASSA